MWPAFAIALVVDALLLNRLSPVRTGVDIVPAFIIASFGNLFLIGVIAPWLARRLVRRAQGAPSLPPEVILDRTATLLMVAGAAGLLAAGLGARPAVVAETRALEEDARLVSGYVEVHAPAEIKRNIGAAHSHRLAEGYFRTCVPYDDPSRAYCLYVDTKRDEVRRDPSTEPNQRLFGPEPGR
jgi:hypothetical protein